MPNETAFSMNIVSYSYTGISLGMGISLEKRQLPKFQVFFIKSIKLLTSSFIQCTGFFNVEKQKEALEQNTLLVGKEPVFCTGRNHG